MREITTVTKVYLFEELTKEQQKKAIDNHRDINVDYEWYEHIYEKAASDFGIEILSFDLGRYEIEIKPIKSLKETATKIKTNLSKDNLLFSYADNYLESLKNDDDDEIYSEEEGILLDKLKQYFWKDLESSYDYLTSDDVIIETLMANKYEFTQDGKIF